MLDTLQYLIFKQSHESGVIVFITVSQESDAQQG